MSRVMFRFSALVLSAALAAGCAFQPGGDGGGEESQQSTGEKLRVEVPRTGNSHVTSEEAPPKAPEPSPWVTGADGEDDNPENPEPSPWDPPKGGGPSGGGGSGSNNGGK